MISHQTIRRLTYFAAIADAGSIRGAAARLNLSVPVLSEALSELEAELGITLATRTTRRFELTDAGVRTQAAARHILETAQNLTELTAPDAPLRGTLGITAPIELTGFWLQPRIRDFCARHPDVIFDLDATDSVVDLRASKIEVAIRTAYVPPGPSGNSAVTLPLVVVVTPTIKTSAGGMVDGPLIDSRLDRNLTGTSTRDGSHLPLTFTQVHRVTNRLAALSLVKAGVGAAMVMRDSVSDELAAGTLVELVPGYEFGAIDLNVHFRDPLPSRNATAFADSLGLKSA